MRILGHYAELWPAAAGLPEGSIKDFATATREFDADRIVAYLGAGSTILSIMGVERDVFDPNRKVIGSSVGTDGVWVWRESLAYYFNRYNLRLNSDFLTHVRELNYQVPPVLVDCMNEFADQLESFL